MARIIFLLLPIINLSAQSNDRFADSQISPVKVNLYYNERWELTPPEKAVYRREASIDFVNMVFSGIYKDFTADGRLIDDGIYDDQGVKQGLQSEYFEDGPLKSTIEYSNTGFIIWELFDDRRKNVITHGTGKFKIPYYDSIANDNALNLERGILAGEFVNGKRAGKWVYEDVDNSRTEEYYRNGKKMNSRDTLGGINPAQNNRILKTDSIHSPSVGLTIFFKTAPGTLSVRRERKHWRISLTSNSPATEEFLFDHTAFAYLNQFFERYAQQYQDKTTRVATFPGGAKALLLKMALGTTTSFQSEAIQAYQELVKGTGTAVTPDDFSYIKLVIDEKGQLKRFRILDPIPPNENEITKTVEQLKLKFLPAMKKGKPYQFSFVIPVSDGLNWIASLRKESLEEVNMNLKTLKVR